ncbi:MAG: hypothetical protein JNK82_21080 [Myxococcaceae bacterium]|nr:hypothetical protein [Myxococcaceae bacterium]
MRLLQVNCGARRYFGAAAVSVFLGISGGFSCKKSEPPPLPKRDFAAGLPQAPTLDGQLAAEAAARLNDADTITIEQLSKALEPQGVTFGPPKQSMGKKQLALYCATADGSEGLIVTVCEYPDAEAAVNGEQESRVLSAQIAGHTARVQGKSVLHLIQKSTTPQATVDKVLATFASLPDAGS